MNEPVRKVIVLGGGSSGLLAAISLKIKLPDLHVLVIRSTRLGTIMVGEGTSDNVPVYLHGFLGIDPKRFHREAAPTWKIGIRFLWGSRSHFNYTFTRQVTTHYERLPRPNSYYCQEAFEFGDVYGALMQSDRACLRNPDGGPALTTNYAYHMENAKLVEFLEKYAEEVGVELIDDAVADVRTGPEGVEALRLESGGQQSADLYVDSSGFRSVLLGKTMEVPFESYKSTLFCDRAVTGGWKRTDEPIKPYTTSETMNAGWAWQIEHEDLINRGYVYSSDFISDDEAEAEFRAKNPKIESTRLVKFVSGSYQQHWVKNVVAIGNAGGFVEPLQSTSLAVICELCAGLVRALVEAGGRRSESQVARYNHLASFLWGAVRRFLAVNYKFNTRIETPFWRACRSDVDLAGAEEVVEYYHANGPSTAWGVYLVSPLDPFGYEGYLTMLLGQKAPHRADYQPAPEEIQFWNAARIHMLGQAKQGMTVRESLDFIRQPGFEWNPEFYRRASLW